MIYMIRNSFVDAVREAGWMSEATREVAEEKVDTIIRNVGYPPHILNQTYMDEAYLMVSNLLFYTIIQSVDNFFNLIFYVLIMF